MKPPELNWRVVLVRPRNPLNIGAAARAMANFGLHDLMVVAPYEPVWQEVRSAVGAEEVVRSARSVERLEEAIGDAALVVGTTAGGRRNLERGLLPLAELPAWLQERREGGRYRQAALLFGSEKTGLSNEAMSFCHALVQIPTAPQCPSMNHGQAVAVCCYELARAGVVSIPPRVVKLRQSDAGNLQSLEHTLARLVNVLDEVGYLKPKSRRAQILKLRRLLLDLGLTNYDVRVLGGILAQIEWKLNNP
jgi:TrmH family RNA methyltransferase